jgi:hypothetical protein
LLDGDPIQREDEWKQWHAIYTDKLKEFE